MAVPPRILHLLAAVAVAAVLFALMRQGGDHDLQTKLWNSMQDKLHGVGSAGAASNYTPTAEDKYAPPHVDDRPTFYEVATAQGTDKVPGNHKNKHQYQWMYDKVLPAFRDKNPKMLEIGLGCDMTYGPGKSYHTWLAYFPQVQLYFLEFDGKCVEKWTADMQDATVIAGDQADPAFLERMLAEHGRDFDVIVDDGGHTMKQQITSFTVLWPAVRPGGVYFIEDLETSWSPMYGGRPGMTDDSADTAMGFTFRLIDEINGQVGHPRGELSASLRSVECMEGICAFYKKRAGEA